MRQQINWHEDCLKNRKKSIDSMRSDIKDMEERLQGYVIDYNLYVSQINKAKKEGKDYFDSDRYGVKRS